MRVLINGLGSAAGAVVSTVSGLFSGIVSVVLGVVFAIYLLADKDRLAGQADRLMRSYLSRRWLERVRYVLSVLNESFHKFIVGQVTEAVILGVLCTLGMLLFRFPYAAMVGSLVGFSALFTVAGAYIGAAAGAIMMLTVSPLKALLFLVFIVVLQQLEGNLIYPRVVGNSIGLPAIWVLVAISVGGGLFGILGMLLGVPITATLYRLLREDVMRREAQRAASVPRGEALEAEPKAADVSAESGTAQPEK
ncbi:MAG: AI-2E family transporter [Clostridia bacterium]|nr:AI-2E family transporter [Clostridia bacterium]